MISIASLSHRPVLTRLATASALLALAVLLCGTAEAGRVSRAKQRAAARAKTAAPAPRPVAPPAAPGMVIAVDPETGTLGLPSPEQMLQLTAQERTGLMRTTVGLTEVTLPNGAVMSDLQGRFMEFTVLRVDGLGRLQFVPVNDEAALIEALARRAPRPTQTWEER